MKQITVMRKFENMIGTSVGYYSYRIIKNGKFACCTYDSPNGIAIRKSGGKLIDMGIEVDSIIYANPS